MNAMKYQAKEAYQNDSVSQYDEVRFRSVKGKLLDRLEKESVIGLLEKYSKKGNFIKDVPR